MATALRGKNTSRKLRRSKSDKKDFLELKNQTATLTRKVTTVKYRGPFYWTDSYQLYYFINIVTPLSTTFQILSNYSMHENIVHMLT